jgi:hypothetical protein
LLVKKVKNNPVALGFLLTHALRKYKIIPEVDGLKALVEI